MKPFFKKYWRYCFLVYWVFYLSLFFTIEHIITADYPGLNIIHTPIDDAIPFLEIFVIPYYIWFGYIAFATFLLLFKGTDLEYLRISIAFAVGMTLCLVICFIWPNGLTLRPDPLPRDNFLTDLIAGLYKADTPTNVFPSIHVYVSLIIHIVIRGTDYVKKHLWIRYVSFVVSILICLSTIFIKQHSIIDVIGGIVMTGLMMLVLYIPKYTKFLNFIRK